MKSEDFGVIELRKYVMAEYQLSLLEDGRELDREVVFASVFPQSNTELGYLGYESISVENAVIRLDEIDSMVKSSSEMWKRKAQLLREAIGTLSEDEREAFNIIVREKVNDAGIPYEKLEMRGLKATEKLCRYLGEQNEVRKREEERQRKQEVRKKVQRFLSA